ncbi:MAG: DNA translocase FtsK [Planctomycetota bacterium]|jgi:hypothetical protein
MARRKKTARKESRAKTMLKKNPAVVCGILLCVIGVVFVLVALSPASTGKVGGLIYDRFLAVVFGRASLLAGVYCVGLGLVLLVARARVKYIAGLTCLFIPALVIADALLGTTQSGDSGETTVHGANLGYLLRSAAANYIGGAGTVLLLIAVALCGILLLTPKPILTGLWRRLRDSRRRRKASRRASASPEPSAAQEPSVAGDAPAKAPPAPVEASDQLSREVKPRQLMLELYNREFVKIPTGLFEEHAGFDTSLPAGTRRQEIIDAFASVNVTVDIGEIRRGPSFEQYEIVPAIGVKVAQVRSCVEDVSLRVKQKVHISRKASGSLAIEVPLAERQTVPYGFLLENTADDAMEIPIAVGVDASFAPFSVDLVELPHLLIAGTTGSGKSIFLKTLIASIMYHLTPDKVRLVLIDPKRVEFGVFSSSLFNACDIITEFDCSTPATSSPSSRKSLQSSRRWSWKWSRVINCSSNPAFPTYGGIIPRSSRTSADHMSLW